jgi:hypothetical protein
MSSTNRKVRKQEHYVTPHWIIDEMLTFVDAVDGSSTWTGAATASEAFRTGRFLDPCAGGITGHSLAHAPPYPEAVRARYDRWPDYLVPARQAVPDIVTVDIREDSICGTIADFLDPDLKLGVFDIVGSNPPFSLACDFVRRAFEHTPDGGVVFMLQRLNWLESSKREAFWLEYPPTDVLIHNRRPGFDPDRPNKTDSVAYAHFFWRKGHRPAYARMHFAASYTHRPYYARRVKRLEGNDDVG